MHISWSQKHQVLLPGNTHVDILPEAPSQQPLVILLILLL
jgi:hypothetical protein